MPIVACFCFLDGRMYVRTYTRRENNNHLLTGVWRVNYNQKPAVVG